MSYMSTIYSYDEFLRFVSGEHTQLSTKDASIRYGQTYFNVLWEFRPSIANKIRATKFDPFHKDEVSPETHLYVSDEWEKMNMEVMNKED